MTPDNRPPPLVPSHIAWPAFVVFLLAVTVTMVVVTVIAARSDGGSRPAPKVAVETVPVP